MNLIGVTAHSVNGYSLAEVTRSAFPLITSLTGIGQRETRFKEEQLQMGPGSENQIQELSLNHDTQTKIVETAKWLASEPAAIAAAAVGGVNAAQYLVALFQHGLEARTDQSLAGASLAAELPEASGITGGNHSLVRFPIQPNLEPVVVEAARTAFVGLHDLYHTEQNFSATPEIAAALFRQALFERITLPETPDLSGGSLASLRHEGVTTVSDLSEEHEGKYVRFVKANFTSPLLCAGKYVGREGDELLLEEHVIASSGEAQLDWREPAGVGFNEPFCRVTVALNSGVRVFDSFREACPGRWAVMAQDPPSERKIPVLSNK